MRDTVSIVSKCIEIENMYVSNTLLLVIREYVCNFDTFINHCDNAYIQGLK